MEGESKGGYFPSWHTTFAESLVSNPDFFYPIVHLIKPVIKVGLAFDVMTVIRVKGVDLLHQFGFDGIALVLSKGEINSQKVRERFPQEDMDMSEFKKGAGYTYSFVVAAK